MHNEIASFLNSKVSGCNAVVNEATVGDSSITISSDHIKSVCEALKAGEWEFNVLQVITGTDFQEENQIEISYIIASFSKNHELILKVRVPRGDENNLPSVDSVCDVWRAADWQERECNDMMGVNFVGHPDPRRILCPDDWQGYPLRKDYVPAKVYNGMEVNPAHKINAADHDFCETLKAKAEDPKKITGSWKYSESAGAATQGDNQ